MTRVRKKRMVQSFDEYMSEEHTGQEKHGENVAPPKDQPNAGGNHIDSDGDIEINVQGN
jgi:hypothetical protein